MAAVTICSDFGAPKIKSDTVFTVSPSISHEVMGKRKGYIGSTPSFRSGAWRTPDPLTEVCVCAQGCLILCDPMDCSLPGSSRDSPGKNTGVGCHFLLQGIFPIQGLNPCLLHWQADFSPLSHQGSPLTEEGMATGERGS